MIIPKTNTISVVMESCNEFICRHIGPDDKQIKEMLNTLQVGQIDELIEKVVPGSIRLSENPNIPEPLSEYDYLKHIKEISLKNKICKNYIGQGYYETITPAVIQRNIFENPGWYTQYTPYQAEIAQGRLESLLNFQTMVSDLTALPIANASLLDEATAAAEAMIMFYNYANKQEQAEKTCFFVDHEIFPQTKEVLYTRAEPLGIQIVEGNYNEAAFDMHYFGAIVQYPDNLGAVNDYRQFIEKAHQHGVKVVMATDLLAITLLTPPGELGADCAVGSAQRFGIPLGYGGPHAAFMSAKDEFLRNMPGRIIGISIDVYGNKAFRMALQTREQHIKREKATSNICTAQALLANMAAMYAVYHGPHGLKSIAKRVTRFAGLVAESLRNKGFQLAADSFFDTITIITNEVSGIREKAERKGINLRYISSSQVGISINETTRFADLKELLECFDTELKNSDPINRENVDFGHLPSSLRRTSQFLTHPVFNSYHTETKLMRYIKSLENKDLSLTTSMIPLGSCTMKLNAATEMMPLSWNHWAGIHPFAPSSQTQGYHTVIHELSQYLCEITALDVCSLQPNSGAQGEYAGLLAIRKYHLHKGQPQRNVMLIPISAHGTNPASAVMAGMKVVVIKALDNGYIDLDDLKQKIKMHANELAGIMITYPSTYGIYEETIKQITELVHQYGGLVYMDGANMNAQVGITAPGLIGADVCHLNLHKTFAIPHGGGGPGMGPICARKELAEFLPGHISLSRETDKAKKSGAVSAAPYGSASILLISYGYIRMLGNKGIKKATEVAILNANYMMKRLQEAYEILFTNQNGYCAHEFIIDLRPFKKTAEIDAEDVAKRLMDYGFHAPTMSFPVPGTIMIEPTESEDKEELDRFCEALLSIREEIRNIENGIWDKKNNPLKNAPHTQTVIASENWNFPYSRMTAAFPLPYVVNKKFWPSVGRINNTYGDRNLVCTCEPVEAYAENFEK